MSCEVIQWYTGWVDLNQQLVTHRLTGALRVHGDIVVLIAGNPSRPDHTNRLRTEQVMSITRNGLHIMASTDNVWTKPGLMTNVIIMLRLIAKYVLLTRQLYS